MMKFFLLLSLLFLAITGLEAQRFQQNVNYTIDVKLDDSKHLLNGTITWEYFNHSPDTLNFIWVHLWPNAYSTPTSPFGEQELRNGSSKFWFASEEDRGYIDSLAFQANGSKLNLEIGPSVDIGKLFLTKPLLPKQTITIQTPFRVKIPSSEFSRLGHSGYQYQICQWYPKPAVYDHTGWHPMPYLNQGEFYSEFGSFDVTIRVPADYYVAATGNMVGAEDEQKWLETRELETRAYYEKGFPKDSVNAPSKLPYKTLRFFQDSVHDFAWFVDREYYLISSEVVLKTGKKVKNNVFFNAKNAQSWKRAPEYMNRIIPFFSENVGPYPYSVCTVVDGALSAGAGMEYPTITVIPALADSARMDEVIAHEIGHNWFYGILASNERDHPWLDEGFNSFYEERYMNLYYPDEDVLSGLKGKSLRKLIHIDGRKNKELNQIAWLYLARANADVPISRHSDKMTSTNYGAIIYKKTPLILRYLEGWMGKAKFDVMMQDWYTQFAFKHPYPEDFFMHVEKHVGKPLPWLKELINTRKRPDYAIKRRSKIAENQVYVKNIGNIQSPIKLTGFKADTSFSFWYDGFKGTEKLSFPLQGIDRLSIAAIEERPDFNMKNDHMRMRGIGKKIEPLKLRFFTSIEDDRFTEIYFSPALGYNVWNGFMPGLLIHNMSPIRKRLEYHVLPMYGLSNSDLAGSASLMYSIIPFSNTIKRIENEVRVKQFATGIAPSFRSISFHHVWNFQTVRKNRAYIYYSAGLNSTWINYQPYKQFPDDEVQLISYGINRLELTRRAKNPVNPNLLVVVLEQGDGFMKAQASYQTFVPYGSKKKGLDIRLFAGSFLYSNPALHPVDVRFRLSGQNNAQDYTFQDTYFSRFGNGNLFDRQFMVRDGGFKAGTFRGQTDQWLATASFISSLPGPVPIKIFLDLGHYVNQENDRDMLNYSGGLMLALGKNIAEIYVPLFHSAAIRQTFSLNGITLGDQIRFVLNLDKLNPLHVIRNPGL